MFFNNTDLEGNQLLLKEKEAALVVFVVFFSLLIILVICGFFTWLRYHFTKVEDEEILPIINNN